MNSTHILWHVFVFSVFQIACSKHVSNSCILANFLLLLTLNELVHWGWMFYFSLWICRVIIWAEKHFSSFSRVLMIKILRTSHITHISWSWCGWFLWLILLLKFVLKFCILLLRLIILLFELLKFNLFILNWLHLLFSDVPLIL